MNKPIIEEILEYGIKPDEILGYECHFIIPNKKTPYLSKGCYQVIKQNRVAHLHKIHGISKQDLGKETEFDTNMKQRYLMPILLKSNNFCQFCDQLMEKSISLTHAQFVWYLCKNEQCKNWIKNRNRNLISVFIGISKSKFYCKEHSYNGNKKCEQCIEHKRINAHAQKIFKRMFN